jgi:hypothetical protein
MNTSQRGILSFASGGAAAAGAAPDLRLMVEEAGRGGQTLQLIPALAKLLDEGIARGEGQ